MVMDMRRYLLCRATPLHPETIPLLDLEARLTLPQELHQIAFTGVTRLESRDI